MLILCACVCVKACVHACGVCVYVCWQVVDMLPNNFI